VAAKSSPKSFGRPQEVLAGDGQKGVCHEPAVCRFRRPSSHSAQKCQHAINFVYVVKMLPILTESICFDWSELCNGCLKQAGVGIECWPTEVKV
jgi:hypothetical protein